MDPLLLSSASSGSWQDLEFLLSNGSGQLHPSARHNQEASEDVEASPNQLPSVSLLEGVNIGGGTVLHIVAGMSRMVRHLISLARAEEDQGAVGCRVKELLEMENEVQKTALHQAVRVGSNEMVRLLMEEDPELASFPRHGASPLYLAVLLEEDAIAETLYSASRTKLSYSGRDGQNALHAAVLRGTELTKKILEWNNDLTTQRDEKGSTPLHFAAALVRQNKRGSVCWQVLEANPTALYQPDNNGLFPIHVAASVGERGTITMFLNKSPSSAGLQDTMGRTFLHVAAEKKKVRIVSFVCRNQSLSWILNMQDNDGNTALHLAIQAGSLLMFGALLGNRKTHLNLSNKKGQTVLDISQYKIPPGLFDDQNSETKIHFALKVVNARSGSCRRDHFEENYNYQLKHNQREELKKVKESTQTLCIGAVLIATVTFGATFALPGGYRDDEHTNEGTPTLAGRYTFDAFIIASTFSFILSAMSIIGLMYSGYAILNPHSRRIYLLVALYLGATSITCFTAAFALGLYMVLAPVAHKSAVAICVISPLVVMCNKTEFWLKWALLVRPLYTRIGTIRTLVLVTTRILFNMLMEFWPMIFIFVWAAYTRNQF